MEDNLKLIGRLRIEHISPRGTIITNTENTVVTLGKAQFAKAIVSGAYASADPMGWMSIGLGSSTIVAGDTALGSEDLRFETVGSTTTTTTTNDTARWIGSFAMIGSKTINEAGLFNASGLDLGSMFSRTTFADNVAISGDQINITWDVDLS